MGRVSKLVSSLVTGVVTPLRVLGNGIGYAMAVVLVLLVPVFLVGVCTFVWLLVFHAVEFTVGLAFLQPLGVLAFVGLPATVNGIPLLYPATLGVLTALALGWPSTDRETDFSPPIISG